MPEQATESILIIGAGPAGLATAYALEQANLSYRVVDKASQIGSTWASLYPSLTLNTSRWFSHMPNKPFPNHYGIFPTGKQYHDYLTEFVAEHHFNIDLGITIHKVSQHGNQWRVEASDGDWLYPVVILCTGIFGKPIMPTIDGMDDYTGQMIHASQFRNPDMLKGQRVLIVGNGPSGVDIAVASGEIADYTAIGMRTGITLKRRYPLGLAHHAWLIMAEYLPKPLCKAIMKQLGKMSYPEQERVGLWKPTGQGGMTAYQGRELLDAVRDGKVIPRHAPIRFDGKCVYFDDNTSDEFDVVIMATGYTPVFVDYVDIDVPYSDTPWQPQSACDWQIGPNGKRGFPLRDTSQHPNGRQVQGYEGLYIVGTFYKGKGAMHNFNIEARVASEQIHNYLAQFVAN